MGYIGNSLESQRITPAVDTFSGNGSTTAFTLSRQVVSNIAVEAYVNNVAQDPNSAFSINASNQIVFTSAPSAGTNNIYVRYNSYVGQYVGIGQGTVGTSALGSISNINSIGNDLTLQINGSDVVDCKVSGDVGIGGDPSTYSLNPKLLVRGPWAAPNAAGAYGGMFVASTDALAADKGGTISLGGVYDGAGSYTRYAAIGGYKNNATSGDYGGYMSFYTRPNGSVPVERMRIDSVGRVTSPYQPVFYAYMGSITTATGPFVFSSTRINVGDGYNTSNGRFTAPIAGNYMFFGHALHRGNGGTGPAELTFYKNGANVNSRGCAYSVASQTSGHIPVQTTMFIPLAAGDYVQLGAFTLGAGSDYYLPDNLSHFSGFLLG
jgi:hypothetical protein